MASEFIKHGMTLGGIKFVDGVMKITATGYSLWNNLDNKEPQIRIRRVPMSFFAKNDDGSYSCPQAAAAAEASMKDEVRVMVEQHFADITVPRSRVDAAAKMFSEIMPLVQSGTDENEVRELLNDLCKSIGKLHVEAKAEADRLAKTVKKGMPTFLSAPSAPKSAPKTEPSEEAPF